MVKTANRTTFILALMVAVTGLSVVQVLGQEDPIVGAMTGGGTVICSQDETTRVNFAFVLHCGAMPVQNPNNLQINWNRNSFHLESITSGVCFDDPAIDPGKPQAAFDTYWINGTGRYNGKSGYVISASFLDAGEPADNDDVAFIITDPDGNTVLRCGGNLVGGNNQAK